MRKFLVLAAALASVAATASGVQAADLPRRKGYSAPAPVVATRRAFTWQGAYVGATAGYGWGKHTKNGRNTFAKPDGFNGGVTAGYNMQNGQIVFGVEGDLGRTGQVESRQLVGGYSKSHLKTLATARGRVGVAADRALFYVTGGYAGGAVTTKVQPNAGQGYKETKWLNGYAVGGGVEYAATDNVTVKGEYLYADLADKTYGGAGAPQVKTGFQDHILRGGVNYKF